MGGMGCMLFPREVQAMKKEITVWKQGLPVDHYFRWNNTLRLASYPWWLFSNNLKDRRRDRMLLAMQQTDDAGMKKMLEEANEIIGDSIEAMNR